MLKRKRLLATLLIVGLFLALLIYIMINEGVFIDKGAGLSILGKKTFIDPGNLLYCSSSEDGAWVVYRKTGQTIISLMDKYGVKRWQKTFTASRLLVSSCKNYTIVGEADDKDISLLDSSGDTLRTWKVAGIPLLCRISDSGVSAIVEERPSTQSQSNWFSTLVVKNIDNSKLFETDLKKTEVIDIKWWSNGVILLVYQIDQVESGQFLIVLNNKGEQIYKTQISQAVGDISVSPNGQQVIWSTEGSVMHYNIDQDQLQEIKQSNIISAGFLADDKVFMLSNKIGFLPPGRRVYLYESDLTGGHQRRRVYPGVVNNHQLLSDGSFVLTTDQGIFAFSGTRGKWFLNHEQEILSTVVDDNGTVYLFTKDNAVSWYEQP